MTENIELLSSMQAIEGLSAYLSNSTEALHIVSGDSSIMWANKTELNFLGYSSEEYIGQSIVDFHKDKEIIADILFRLLAGEVLVNYPAKLLAKNGDIKQVLINSSGYWKDGAFSHTRCFSRDVTGLFDLSDKIELRIAKIKADYLRNTK